LPNPFSFGIRFSALERLPSAAARCEQFVPLAGHTKSGQSPQISRLPAGQLTVNGEGPYDHCRGEGFCRSFETEVIGRMTAQAAPELLERLTALLAATQRDRDGWRERAITAEIALRRAERTAELRPQDARRDKHSHGIPIVLVALPLVLALIALVSVLTLR
jgi:hypothetical protein